VELVEEVEAVALVVVAVAPFSLMYLLPLLAHLPTCILSFLAHFLAFLLHLSAHICHSVRHLLHHPHLSCN
jgi:hypothetical protein